MALIISSYMQIDPGDSIESTDSIHSIDLLAAEVSESETSCK